jgi:molybdenum cofactor biosynthesis enzyme
LKTNVLINFCHNIAVFSVKISIFVVEIMVRAIELITFIRNESNQY